MPNPLRSMYDGFQNLVANLQTRADKASYDTFSFDADYSPSLQEIEAAYGTSWFRKIVDIPPFDSVREWREWQAEDAQIELIEAEEKRLMIPQRILSGLTWGRLYGGAALILGVKNSGDPAIPLDVNRVGQGGLEYVHAVDRYSLVASELDLDPVSPEFGKPLFYTLNGGDGKSVRIHPSRVIRFIGMPMTDRMARMNQGWGDGLWRSMHRKIKNAEMTEIGIAALVHEAKIDIIKVPNMMQNIATAEYTGLLQQRFALAGTLKSINNMLLLDKEEEWDRKEINFSALPDVLRLYLAIMAGISDIPATRLLGKSPDGMNATGDSDIRNYYDMVKSRQELELRPALQTLDECLIRSALGSRPPEIGFEWVSLWQMDPKEKADIDKVKADTAKVYVDAGLVPDVALAEGVQNMLVEDGTYPGLDQALADAEAAGEVAPIEEEPVLPTSEQLALAGGGGAPGLPKPGGNLPAKVPAKDAQPRTLYVYRPVLNAATIIAWAKKQGFKTTLPGDDMHVTIAFSKAPIDWMKVGPSWTGNDKGEIMVPPGGPRLVEPLGGAIVLLFSSWELSYRHGAIREAGASWDYAEYQPHISITYEPGNLRVSEVEPYRGPIVLGPEVFEEIKANVAMEEA